MICVEGIERFLCNPTIEEGKAPHRVLNIWNNNFEIIMEFIETLEIALSNVLGKEVVFEKI